MAHVEIRVDANHHVTLAHFEQMDPEKYLAIYNVLVEVQNMVKYPPTGRFGKTGTFGQWHNVEGRLVDSPYVLTLQQEIHRRFDEAGILYSNNFENVLHISRPLFDWHEGKPVPFHHYMDLRWKSAPDPIPAAISFELGKGEMSPPR